MLEDDIAENFFVILSSSMLIDTNLLDDCIAKSLEDAIILEPDVVMICIVLGCDVLLDLAVIVPVVLLGITVDKITLFGVTLVVLTANILTEFEVIELGMLNDVGNISPLDIYSSFESLHFPLVRLKLHSVTCLLFWPPNINHIC